MMKIYVYVLTLLMVMPLYAAVPAAQAARCPRRIECSDRCFTLGIVCVSVLGTAALAGFTGYAVAGGYISPSRAIAVAPCGPCQSVYSTNICQPSNLEADNLAQDDIKILCNNPNPIIYNAGKFSTTSTCISLLDVAAQFKTQCPTNATGLDVKPTPKEKMRSKLKLMADKRAGKVI